MPHKSEEIEEERMDTNERKWTDGEAGGVGTKQKRKATERLVRAGDSAAVPHRNSVSQHCSYWGVGP